MKIVRFVSIASVFHDDSCLTPWVILILYEFYDDAFLMKLHIFLRFSLIKLWIFICYLSNCSIMKVWRYLHKEFSFAVLRYAISWTSLAVALDSLRNLVMKQSLYKDEAITVFYTEFLKHNQRLSFQLYFIFFFCINFWWATYIFG